jgi:hypothetical protein
MTAVLATFSLQVVPSEWILAAVRENINGRTIGFKTHEQLLVSTSNDLQTLLCYIQENELTLLRVVYS